MSAKKIVITLAALALLVLGTAQTAWAEKLKVVVTSSSYAPIARYVGGDKVEVSHIVAGNQDPHIVRPKPSHATTLRDADVLVVTGMDLEMWAPALVDMSNNPHIRSGQKGFVSASAGLDIIEVPVTVSRAEGDVHIYGNPHVHTSPLNGKVIAENIFAGLKRNAPEHADYFERNLKRFRAEVDRRTFGAELVQMMGSKVLTSLAHKGRLVSFLEEKQYKGKPMIEYLGGWMKQAMPLRGKKIVCYHKNWSYFADLFGLEIVEYMEPKPGIPPTPKHVATVLDKMRSMNVKVMLAANYFDVGRVERAAAKAGAVSVVTALAVGGEPGMNGYFDQYDIWIRKLLAAFQRAG